MRGGKTGATKTKPKTHRRWRCPKCDATYSSPIPIIEVWCSERASHPGRVGVAMRPDAGDADA